MLGRTPNTSLLARDRRRAPPSLTGALPLLAHPLLSWCSLSPCWPYPLGGLRDRDRDLYRLRPPPPVPLPLKSLPHGLKSAQAEALFG